MREYLDFGKLGLRIMDCITLAETGDVVMIAPGFEQNLRRSIFVRTCRSGDSALWTLAAMTRKILGSSFDPRADVWSMWLWRGHTLRELASGCTSTRV